jgi:hypothetical protein
MGNVDGLEARPPQRSGLNACRRHKFAGSYGDRWGCPGFPTGPCRANCTWCTTLNRRGLPPLRPRRAIGRSLPAERSWCTWVCGRVRTPRPGSARSKGGLIGRTTIEEGERRDASKHRRRSSLAKRGECPSAAGKAKKGPNSAQPQACAQSLAWRRTKRWASTKAGEFALTNSRPSWPNCNLR